MRLKKAKNLVEFFRERVQKIRRRQKIQLTEMAEYYLVDLLSNLSGTREWVEGEPLALIYGRALECGNAKERFGLFKELGDRSLYISGFFGDSLARRSIDIGYFISMGEIGYGSVSSMAESIHRSRAHPEIFSELAEKFARLVELLSEISESAGILSNQDVVRIYERYQATGSERLLRLLSEKGIIPHGGGKVPSQ